MHISRLDDVECKHLTSDDVRFKIVHLKTAFSFYMMLELKHFFRAGELSLIFVPLVCKRYFFISNGFHDLRENDSLIAGPTPRNDCELTCNIKKTVEDIMCH